VTQLLTTIRWLDTAPGDSVRETTSSGAAPGWVPGLCAPQHNSTGSVHSSQTSADTAMGQRKTPVTSYPISVLLIGLSSLTGEQGEQPVGLGLEL